MISEDRLELNLERAAHRETRAYLARMTQAAQYWQTRARWSTGERDTEGLPIPDPIPIPAPTPAGSDGGGQLLVVVSEVMVAVAYLARRLALQQGGATPDPAVGEWIAEVQTRVDRLVAALPAGTGVGDTHTPGDQRGYPPTQPHTGGRAGKQGEHQTNPPTA